MCSRAKCVMMKVKHVYKLKLMNSIKLAYLLVLLLCTRVLSTRAVISGGFAQSVADSLCTCIDATEEN